jgi:hypothetical protein
MDKKDLITVLGNYPFGETRSIINSLETDGFNKDTIISVMNFLATRSKNIKGYVNLFTTMQTGEDTELDMRPIFEILNEYKYNDVKSLIPILDKPLKTKEDMISILNFMAVSDKEVGAYILLFKSLNVEVEKETKIESPVV